MNDNDTFAFENREYVSPTVSRDEQLGFIDNLRQTRDENVARINADTYNLGTQVPSIKGGLGGSNATFEGRYVTPYVNSTIQGLKTVAQQTALTQALENLRAQYKQRYNEAYRAAKARANAGTGGGGDDSGDVNLNIIDDTNPTGTWIENNVPGTIAVDTGANVQRISLSDGSVVERENYPTIGKTYHPTFSQVKDLASRYSKEDLQKTPANFDATNSKNGFYLNEKGQIIAVGSGLGSANAADRNIYLLNKGL